VEENMKRGYEGRKGEKPKVRESKTIGRKRIGHKNGNKGVCYLRFH
jgi:hypothetical protein